MGSYSQRSALRLSGDTPAREAARRLVQCDVRCAIVEGPDGTPEGLLTDRELTLQVLCGQLAPDSVSIRELSRAAPVPLPHDVSLRAAVTQLRANGVRTLLLADDKGEGPHCVTSDDLVMWFAGTLHALVDALQGQLTTRSEVRQ